MRRRCVSLLVALFSLLALGAGRLAADAQSPLTVELSQHDARYREHVVFRLLASGEAEIEEVTLFYRVADQSTVNHATAEHEPGRQVEAEYTWDLSSGGLPPGVQITYWWEVADRDGQVLESEPQSFLYVDERQDWRTLASDDLVLYWYLGDDDFGQALFDRAIDSLSGLSQNAGIEVSSQVKVFIYGSHADLLGAIAEGAKEWTGGQAFADVGVVVIGVSPGNLAWGQRAVAHELSHLVVHQVVDTPLGGVPRWLDEGLAMYTEGALEPSYERALEQASRDERLITVRSLSSSFPADSELAHLSYAQSYDLVRYIIEEHGRDKMAELLRAFADGAYYDDALREVLGLNSDGLDAAWREWSMPSRPPQREEDVAPPFIARESLLHHPAVLAVTGLCCAGGLVIMLVGGLVVIRRRG